MDPVPLFLNEHSYPIQLEGKELLDCVLSLLSGIRRAKELAGEVILGSTTDIRGALITDSGALAGILTGRHADWWRFIRNLQQRAPFHLMPACVPPEEGSHVVPDSSRGDQALLWAHKNDAFVVSFPSAVDWSDGALIFRHCVCGDLSHCQSFEGSVMHISNEQHSDRWKEALQTFVHSEAASSVIFDDGELVLKMYLHDHGPPHVHVFLSSDLGVCIAKIRFDTYPEIIRGKLTGRQRGSLFSVVVAFHEQLMNGWQRCSRGLRPQMLVTVTA